MKKVLKTTLGCVAASLAALSLASCEDSIGKETVKYSSQLDALNKVNEGTVDVAIIDSIMAGYYTTRGSLAGKLAIAPVELVTEEYAVAAKKGNQSLINKINEAFYALQDTEITAIATHFGVIGSLKKVDNTSTAATDSSWDDIVADKKVTIGYTVFAPIAYTDPVEKYKSDNFTGYDIEVARAVFEYLDSNIEVEFLEIEWDAKEALLANGTIDLVWNGLTVTEERANNMCLSKSYLNNKQVVVCKTDKVTSYNTKEDLANAIIGVEDGSAGCDVATGN